MNRFLVLSILGQTITMLLIHNVALSVIPALLAQTEVYMDD